MTLSVNLAAKTARRRLARCWPLRHHQGRDHSHSSARGHAARQDAHVARATRRACQGSPDDARSLRLQAGSAAEHFSQQAKQATAGLWKAGGGKGSAGGALSRIQSGVRFLTDSYREEWRLMQMSETGGWSLCTVHTRREKEGSWRSHTGGGNALAQESPRGSPGVFSLTLRLSPPTCRDRAGEGGGAGGGGGGGGGEISG